MNVMFSGIVQWSHTTQNSNHRDVIKTTHIGQNDFKNLLGIEKVNVSSESNNLKEARALIKEVGFVKFALITRVVNQIQRALKRVTQTYPVYQKTIKAMIVSYDIQMPRSVREAFSRLREMIRKFKLPQEVVDTIMQYIEEEMKKATSGKNDDRRINLDDKKFKLNSDGISPKKSVL